MFDILTYLCINFVKVVNPLLLLTFAFFFIICLLIYILQQINSNLNKEKGLLTQINDLYIQNISIICLRISLYLFGTLILLLILRYINIGSVIDISTITIHDKISSYSLILITEIIFIMMLYRRILDLLFYKDIYRLHLYLFKYLKYEKYMEIIKDSYTFSTMIFIRFQLFITSISEPSYDLDKAYNQRKVLQESFRTSKNHILTLIPSFITFIVFLYDLTLLQIYYTYYALFVYLVIQNVNKLRKFIYEKDFMLDRILYEQLYTSIQTNDKIAKILGNTISTKILGNWEVLINYINNQCKIYYILEHEVESNIRYNYIKKVYMILGIAIMFVMFVMDTDAITITLAIPLAIAIACATINKDNGLSKAIFWLSTILQVSLCLYFYIKRNMIIYMSETLWIFSDGYTIIQTFSTDEKLDFLYKYIVYNIKHIKGFPMDQKLYLIDILTNINYKDIISDSTTITQLREYVDSLLLIYQRLEIAYIYCRINVDNDGLITNIESYHNTNDTTKMIFIIGTLATCFYILPPVFIFLDAYIQITNPKLHVILVLGKKTYRTFRDILKMNYPDDVH
jgi:hypothetical protein